MKPSHLLSSLLLAATCTLLSLRSVPAQNVIDTSPEARTAPPIQLTSTQVDNLLRHAPAPGQAEGNEARRVAGKLEKHVDAFLQGWPWLPFHHTLGISGYEAYFNHPDEMFYALALALPHLSQPLAARVKEFGARQLAQATPYATDGWNTADGHPRERYAVPSHLRWRGRAQAGSAFGVYAFWAWCHYAQDTAAARAHWLAVRDRTQPLLAGNYVFDIQRRNYSKDEAEKLNGDLAGMLGLVRLARLNADPQTEKAARDRFAQLLELRVNLERVNPQILEKTTASKSLHVSKLARYGDLAPEIGEAVRTWSDGCGAERLRCFREARNAWYLAFGDRLIGGENYTNPAHFPRALFAGATWVEALPAEQLLTFIDVPWCAGDFYFMEKCALALWAASGRAWAELE